MRNSYLVARAPGFTMTTLVCCAAPLFAAFVLIIEQAVGAPIYSQVTPAEPVGAFSSQNTTSGQIIADNFSLSSTSAVTVRSVRLIGGRTSDSPSQPVDDFRLVFLEDKEGIPADIVGGGDLSGGLITLQSSTGGQLLNGRNTPIEYFVDLRNGVLLNPNTEYWIAITNDPGPGFGWLWARANGTLDSRIATVSSTSGTFTNLPWVVGASSGGMWFELSDQNVPEPSSLVLIAYFVSVFFMRCRFTH